MKRKAKIITTIASLCLAVALLAFGVYAATTASLSVTSKVAFEAKDVNVTFTAKVAGGNVPTNSNDEPWGKSEGWSATSNNYTGVAGVANTDLFTVALVPQGNNADDHYSFVTTGGNDSAGTKITYTFTITNNGRDPINITYTGTNTFSEVSNILGVTYKIGSYTTTPANPSAGTWASQTNVAYGTTWVYEVELSLLDITASLPAAQNLNISFSVLRTAAAS